MSESQQNPHRTKKPVSRWHWIVGISLLLIVVITAVGILIFNARPILRTRVIETLSARFKSKVELDAFDVSLVKGFQVSGEGLRLFGDAEPNNHERQGAPGREAFAHGDGVEVDTAQTGGPIFQQEWSRH